MNCEGFTGGIQGYAREKLHIQTYPPKIDGWKLEEETSF